MPLQYLQRIAETPAPTFDEGRRAALMLQLWQDLGYTPQLDGRSGNVLLRLEPPGTAGQPALLLAAHLDSVFGPETDVTVRQSAGRWTGPGLGDNASSLAVLTAFLRDLDPASLRRPLWLAANVAEEGLGDLRGAKDLMARHAPQLAALVAVDGYLGSAVTQAVGVRRYRARFVGQGGHSWGAAVPSAIHALARAVSDLYALPLPAEPRTTLNVGTVGGGTTVNSIAAQAELLLDLRSLSGAHLHTLDEAAQDILHRAAREVGVGLDLERVGDRPGGHLQAEQLYGLAAQAAQAVGLRLQQSASSTDANAAVPYGLPALTLGVYRGGQAHREDEWVDPYSHAQGLALLQEFVRRWQWAAIH